MAAQREKTRKPTPRKTSRNFPVQTQSRMPDSEVPRHHYHSATSRSSCWGGGLSRAAIQLACTSPREPSRVLPLRSSPLAPFSRRSRSSRSSLTSRSLVYNVSMHSSGLEQEGDGGLPSIWAARTVAGVTTFPVVVTVPIAVVIPITVAAVIFAG